MISEKQFVNVINAIGQANQADEALGELLKTEGFICYSSELVAAVIKTLAEAFNDTGEWIDYWIYELDMGKSWNVTSCSRTDGTIIKLKTPEDLYCWLLENM